ncbi:protein translocase subunit SecF [Thiohalobacter thiocyanaticus]|uniref:Protein-export membrane protein SecF n=1 Tax=Thiohalobacter thiocyanaticus TaxID=585455 RepID=A0A426QGI8_9GAMM|nr:protein translocase subunit SecF [Thiohalobacter thiocyanaticus]RRQ20867.1 protein translocase subunit SecF [Thiohalobacter thiocyanaticus]
MRLLSGQTNIDFMGKRKLAFAFSLLLILVAIGSLATRGLNFGIDFTGGTLIEVGYPQPQELESIRTALQDDGFEAAQVQYFGSSREVLIRLAPRAESQAELSSRLLTLLREHNAGVEMRRVEFVGAQVGEELTEKGGLAMLYALIGILVYVTLRFEYRLSVGAVAALIHDVTITLGLFSVTQMEFDLTVLAALLAIIGYSLNDTIVVFDRIRENFRKIRKQSPAGVMNASINQTLSRTLMTSLTTLLVVVALFVLGGEVIHSFAFALLVGILVGTYSSIYVASNVALQLGVSKQDLMPVKKEGPQVDDQP